MALFKKKAEEQIISELEIVQRQVSGYVSEEMQKLKRGKNI
jgi:hypothetical protein